MSPTPQIAILDYGSQVTHLLAREIRKLKVYSVIVDHDTPAAELTNYKGIVLSGGPNSVYDTGAPSLDPKILELGIPVLGVCYGHQLMTHLLGGKVEPGDHREYGKADLVIKDNNSLLKDFDNNTATQVWMSHGDSVTQMAPGFEAIAVTADCPTAIIADTYRHFYGMQFHPEVNHSLEGDKMLSGFLDICGCERSWELPDFLNQKIAEIQAQAKDKNVFLLISGGVDSTVAFALLSKALGPDRVRALLVDTGFMRKDEIEQVTKALKDIGVTQLTVAKAADNFFTALQGKADPEAKRNIIGDTFLTVKDDMTSQLDIDDDNWLLGQGTIYPDTIESGGTKNADKIKTHHNRVDKITELIAQGKVIEPLADLYKDEVREIGRLLGLPDPLVDRHPFPGPGLAVRTLCTDGAEPIADYDATIQRAIQLIDQATDLPTITPEVLPIKSVGVQGDGRTYRHPLALQVQQAPAAYLHDLLPLATDLTNKLTGINRVVLDIYNQHKLSSYQTVEHAHMVPERVAVLQEADAIFTDLLFEYAVYPKIWQAPVVLLPIAAEPGTESIVLRPVASNEAMTADAYPLPTSLLDEYLKRLKDAKLPISGVFYDLTHKPPGTIEWE